MGFGPLFYTFVQLLLIYLFRKCSVNFLKVRTLGDLWAAMFPGKTIARFFAILCAFNCIMVVFSEILAASDMLSTFLPPNAIYKITTFFSLILVGVTYVSYGGYKAVVKTDGWQFIVFLFTTSILIYFAVNSPILNNSTSFEITTKLFNYNAKGSSLLIFLIWAVSINIAGAVTDMALWHRMASSISMKEAFIGFIQGSWKWFVIFMLPMMCFVLLYLKGNHYNNLTEFFNIVQKQSGILGYIILPTIVVGFTAAAFSTADTYMIAAMYALCDNHTFLPGLKEIPEDKRAPIIKKYVVTFMLSLLCLLGTFYYLRQSTLNNLITPIMYIIWGQISMISPLVVYAVYRLVKKKPSYHLTQLQNYIIIGAWIVGLLLTIYTSSLGNNLYSQIVSFIGIALVVMGMFLSFNIYKMLDICKYLLWSKKVKPLFNSR